MTKKEFESSMKQLHQAPVSRSLFGARYLLLDETTRVRFGFSLDCLGRTYKLQRKAKGWKTVAWTYPETHSQELEEIVEYLFWYEEENKQPLCLF